MAIANSELIWWLLHDSGVSRYHVSKVTGIPESTLSRIASGATKMDAVSMGIASKITAYAETVKDSRGYIDDKDGLRYLAQREQIFIDSMKK